MSSRKAAAQRALYYTFRARAETVRLFDRMRRSSTRDTLIVFDPALQGFDGHHLEIARLIKSELSAAYNIKFYANLRAATRIVAGLPALPICYDSIYPPPGDFQVNYEQGRTSLIASLRKIDLRDLTPRTIFYMHTLTVYQLGGLAEWFAGLSPGHRPKLLLQFQFPHEFGVRSEPDWPKALGVAREATNALSSAGNVIFATNSDLLKDKFERELGHTWELLPMPVRWPNHVRVAPLTSGPVFGFYGGLRPEKGSRILAEAVSSFLRRYPDAQFIVHAPRLPGCDEIAAQQLSHLSQVELIRSDFRDKDAYFSQFCRAHFVLLPYDPAAYALRTSGILIEAIGLGRRVITTDGTWMANQLHKRPAAGVMMASYSAQALYDCLEVARDVVMEQPWIFDLDHEVMSSNAPSAYCAALLRAVEV